LILNSNFFVRFVETSCALWLIVKHNGIQKHYFDELQTVCDISN